MMPKVAMTTIVGRLFFNPGGPVTVQLYELSLMKYQPVPEVPAARIFIPLDEIAAWQIGKRFKITIEDE
jgi:hypothetical protein